MHALCLNSEWRCIYKTLIVFCLALFSSISGGAFGPSALRRLYADLRADQHSAGAGAGPGEGVEGVGGNERGATRSAASGTALVAERLQAFITPHSVISQQTISSAIKKSTSFPVNESLFDSRLLVFPATLNSHERHTIHAVADELNASSRHANSALQLLYHQSFDLVKTKTSSSSSSSSMRQLLVSCVSFSATEPEIGTLSGADSGSLRNEDDEEEGEEKGIGQMGSLSASYVALAEGLSDSGEEEKEGEEEEDNTPPRTAQTKKQKQKLKQKQKQKLGGSSSSSSSSSVAGAAAFSSIGGRKAPGAKASKVSLALENDELDEWALMELSISENEVRSLVST